MTLLLSVWDDSFSPVGKYPWNQVPLSYYDRQRSYPKVCLKNFGFSIPKEIVKLSREILGTYIVSNILLYLCFSFLIDCAALFYYFDTCFKLRPIFLFLHLAHPQGSNLSICARKKCSH